MHMEYAETQYSNYKVDGFAAPDDNQNTKMKNKKVINILKQISTTGMLCAIMMTQSTALCSGNYGLENVNIAVMHGIWRGNSHHDEFDFLAKKLGWKLEKFASAEEDMDKLASELNKFDMVAVCPLFNYSKGDVAQVDMAKYGAEFRKYIEGGGALVIVDALYTGLYTWVTSIDPSLKLDCGECKASQNVANMLPENSIRFFPNRLREDNTWGHLELPEGHGWDIISACSEGNPQAVMKRFGKGYIYVTGLRSETADFLENLIVTLKLQHAGLSVTNFELPEFKLGSDVLRVSMTTLSNEYSEVEGTVKVIPLDIPEQEQTFRNTLKRTFRKKFKIVQGEECVIEIPYTIDTRGRVRIIFEIASGKQKTTLLDKTIFNEYLLNITGPRYRSFAVESDLKKRKGQIISPVEICPYDEDLKDFTLRAEVKDANGKRVGKVKETRIAETNFLLPIYIGTPKPGSYTITGELYHKKKLVDVRNAELAVLSDDECPVYINDDMNLVVDGEEFFTLGIYHPINFNDIARIAEIGFNLVQVFDGIGPSGFTVTAEHGIKVLYEQNHNRHLKVSDEALSEHAAEISATYSNLCLWYVADEPGLNGLEHVKKIDTLLREGDKGHPTYLVSYKTHLFDVHAPLADIFAVDPYPFPKRPITMVSDWVDLAWEATKGNRPVFCVPQSFGGEPPETLYAMAYLAVIHEARGLIWYPWDDRTEGLKFNAESQEVMKSIVSELKILSPALLNREGRRQFKSEDGKIHGLYCQENPGKRYMLLVNPETSEQTINLKALAGLKGVKELKEVFGNEKIKLSETGELTLNQYETRVYTCN